MAHATNAFFVSEHADESITEFDGGGNITRRIWFDGTGQFLRVQTFQWDLNGRMESIHERDRSGDGHDWSAVYDGFGRRLRTVWKRWQSNAGQQPIVTDSWFDPEVEFLEIGAAVGGQRLWYLYGPHPTGTYGQMQGHMALDAIIGEGTVRFVIHPLLDQLGNVIGTARADLPGDVTWDEREPGDYGPARGHQPSLEFLNWAEPSAIAAAFGWRGRRVDPTGYCWLGARYYDPDTGRFLSTDPLGHAAGADLYSFAAGDPVNQFDADGRLSRAALRAGGTIATGVINSGLGVVALPLVGGERLMFYARRGSPVEPYFEKHLERALLSAARFYESTADSSLLELVAALAHQLPLLGNFVPGPRGNMAGAPTIFLIGGIGGSSEHEVALRDQAQVTDMRTRGVNDPVSLAPHLQGTATEVLLSMFLGYTAPALEFAAQVREQVSPGSAIYIVAHSGGVSRSSIGSFYLGYADIGVARAFVEQGPGIGFFRNIGQLTANYSLGQDVVSNFGALISPLYLGGHSSYVYSLSSDRHLQGGNDGGNEFNAARALYLRQPR